MAEEPLRHEVSVNKEKGKNLRSNEEIPSGTPYQKEK